MRFRICSKLALSALFCCASLSTLAANDDGTLDSKLTESLRHSMKMDRATQALLNAVTGTDAKKLAVNRAIVQGYNDVSNHKINTKGVTNQQRSGRCWLFAALNIMRPAVIEKYKLDDFAFSLNYLAFWDKLEKANFFLETIIDLRQRDPLDRELDYFMKDPISDGGWWDYVVALIEKYGVMPKDAMSETYPSDHTDVMNEVLATKLRVDATQLRRMAAEKKSVPEMCAAKKKMLREIYRILVMNYGQPPVEFAYRYVDKDKKVSPLKKYTPQGFYKEWVGVDLSQYVQMCNDPTQPYEKHYSMRRVKDVVGCARRALRQRADRRAQKHRREVGHRRSAGPLLRRRQARHGPRPGNHAGGTLRLRRDLRRRSDAQQGRPSADPRRRAGPRYGLHRR